MLKNVSLTSPGPFRKLLQIRLNTLSSLGLEQGFCHMGAAGQLCHVQGFAFFTMPL